MSLNMSLYGFLGKSALQILSIVITSVFCCVYAYKCVCVCVSVCAIPFAQYSFINILTLYPSDTI